MVDSWDFSGSADWYDIILGKSEYKKNAGFVVEQLKKYNVKAVLELACGTGLYLIPLKKAGFEIEGLDISGKMLSAARKKSKSIKLYQQDMSSFAAGKRYDAILILNSGLALLPDQKAIDKAIARCARHLSEKGILMIDLPNHKKEIKESNFTQSHDSFIIPNGKLDVIFRDFKENNKWVSEWHGFVKQGNRFSQFKEHYEELIFSPKAVENGLKNNGFRILKVFGSRRGGRFNPENSLRKFYLCRKR